MGGQGAGHTDGAAGTGFMGAQGRHGDGAWACGTDRDGSMPDRFARGRGTVEPSLRRLRVLSPCPRESRSSQARLNSPTGSTQRSGSESLSDFGQKNAFALVRSVQGPFAGPVHRSHPVKGTVSGGL